MRTEVIPLIAERTLEAAILALVPIALIALGTRVVNAVRDARVPWTPFVEFVSFVAGLAAGVIIFGWSMDTEALGPSEVFRVGGPWDLSFGAFLARVANPSHYDWLAVFRSPAGPPILIFAAAVIVAPIFRFRSGAAVVNAVRNAFLVFSGAYAAIYGLGYCLWLMNRLNFWVFLLLMILIHIRGRSDKIELKLH